jgi:hypothetical protein
MMALPNLSGLSLHAAAPTAGWNDLPPPGMFRRASSGDLGPNTQPSEEVRKLWQDAADERARQEALERDTDEYRASQAKLNAMLEQEQRDRDEAYRVWMQDRAQKEALKKQAAFAQLEAEEMAKEARAAERGLSFEYNNGVRERAELALTDPRVAMLHAEIEAAWKRLYTAPNDEELKRAQKELQTLVIRARGIAKGVWPF